MSLEQLWQSESAGRATDAPKEVRMHRKRYGYTRRGTDAPEEVRMHRKRYGCTGKYTDTPE
jgi:sRNA-binding carbon storage regulator CsrA